MQCSEPMNTLEAMQAMARELGFEVAAVCEVPPALRIEYYRRWIAEGQHGTMQWMERNNDRRLNPAQVLPQARSIITVGLNYYQPDPERRYRIAKYALGRDYHKLIYKRLKRLCLWLKEHFDSDQRPYVDTGPVLEKGIAAQAGLGWQGKSTILLHPRLGTWLFLGVIFTTAELQPTPLVADHCGRCTRCIDVCPTRAITAPYQLDARRCLSYLTIEHDGPIAPEFRRPLGDRLYGCDECLDVCPWNRWATRTREAHLTPRSYPGLTTMLHWTEAQFKEAMLGTAIRRLGLTRWQRNLCLVLGNVGDAADLPALERFRTQTALEWLREHAQWAITQIRARGDAPSAEITPQASPES